MLKRLIILSCVSTFIILVVVLQFVDFSTQIGDFKPFITNSSMGLASVVSCAETPTIKYSFYDTSRPLFEKNNKFGLYIYAENKEFLDLADDLVNSNGGDWGYVLVPYNIQDQDYPKWRELFAELKNKHLIPVIQLHDVNPDDYETQTLEAAEFLNTFVWPVKQRFISVYNEPNDSKFWHGYVDPEEYVEILSYTIDAFKKVHEDFYMLNGALNISASDGGGYMDALEFMRKMDAAEPGVFSKLDGWASHSYPQPNFSGDPYTKGRWGIRAYEVELAFLETELNVSKELPVFITETGWAHAEGDVYNASFLPVQTVGENFATAYEDIWLKDDRVVAVMPFTIRYNPPYDHFSWVNSDNVPYAHFEVVKGLEKVSGKPQILIERMIEGTCDDAI